MHVLALLSLAMLVYVYLGYPLLLWALVQVRGRRLVTRAGITPPVSLVISAFNEGPVIRRKIENALALDYPRERLEIVVISDASNDDTDAIVGEYADHGVTLARQPLRLGKTAGLNRTVPHLAGEIVVFSDANALYESDALRKLVRNFADPEVGCVTGEARYVPGGEAGADVGERVYWSYEMQVKRLETALASMVGGDGAIYGIRRVLWQELPDNAINDFLNPLQIVAAGWRAVYEPEAVCHEETAGGTRTEYRRRVRIVSRSWRALFQARDVLNPFRVGIFAWCVVSHKALRWLTGIFASLLALALLGIAFEAASSLSTRLVLIAILASGAVLATARGRRVFATLVYFGVINAASIVGVWKGATGRVSGTWTTPRDAAAQAAAGPVLPLGRMLLFGSALAGLSSLALLASDRFAAMVFWTSTAVLAYVYVGYPLLLAAMRSVATQPVRRAPIEPHVCVLIAANDEAAIIETKLQNTLALDYPTHRLDVVVASDGSVDGTNAIVARFAPRVRLLELAPRRGKIGALNEAMRAITSEIVVFSDANTFLEPDAVRALVRGFADERVGAVSGDVVLIGNRAALGASEDLYYRYERWVQQAESDIGSMIGADGALYAIRRELFVPPPLDTILDDLAIPMAVMRAGRRVVFDGTARAFEQGSESAREEFARKSRVIAGAVQFMRRAESDVALRDRQGIFSFVSHKGLRWWSPLFATCAFLASVALANSSHAYATALGAQLVLIVFGLAGCAPALRRLSFVGAAHYFCLVQAAAVVGSVRGLMGRQSVLWTRFERSKLQRHQPAA